MRTRFRTVLLVSALFLSVAATARAQADFSVYVSIGDSLAAGYSSGSLVEAHQRNSVPALLARQGGAPEFQQPTISEPGIPAELQLLSLLPSPLIAPKSTSQGEPTNASLGRSYNNLAVPGARAREALDRGGDAGGFHDLILRGRGSQVEQAKDLAPSFITLWIGNADVLGAAIRGRAEEGETLTPATEFRATYAQIVSELRSTGATIVAANLPDVTSIPFVTTIPPVVVNPSTGEPVVVNGRTVPLIGPGGPLASDAFVTLAASTLLAQGIGIPRELGGRGTSLPGDVILDAGEIAVIRDHVAQNNQAIRDICRQNSIPLLDVNALLHELATTGREIGGLRLNSEFLSGGIFSYDGVHPTDLGYALVANEWIRVINENGGGLSPVNLTPYLAAARQLSASARKAGFEWSDEAWGNLLRAFPEIRER